MGESKPNKLLEIAKEIFGSDNVKEYCVNRTTPNKYNVIPKGKVVNVYVVIEPVSRLIIRHEQETSDVTTVPTYLGVSIPAILNTKFQSGAVRRQMLALLHEWFDRKGKEFIDLLKNLNLLKGLGFDETYRCVMRPYMRQQGRRGGQAPEGFEGYCTKCPNCLIFGYAVQEGGLYNVKSRVEGDLYVAVIPERKAVVETVFNAVDDVTKTTFRPESEETLRTGALYTFTMIEAGVPFVGKLVLKDLTLAELLLTLLTLARTTRVGGRQTHFGEIKVHIPAILFSKFELGSGYELAHRILNKYSDKRPSIEDVINELLDYVEQFKGHGLLFTGKGQTYVDLADKLRNLKEEDVDQIILNAWVDVLIFKQSLEKFVSGEEKRGEASA